MSDCRRVGVKGRERLEDPIASFWMEGQRCLPQCLFLTPTASHTDADQCHLSGQLGQQMTGRYIRCVTDDVGQELLQEFPGSHFCFHEVSQ